jgi:hypothetical protein
VAVLAGNLVVAVAGRLDAGGRTAGPSGSSYVTTANGTAAWAELLETEGRSVTRLRGPYRDDRLDPAATLVLAEIGFAAFARPELSELADFVAAGGWLLLAGPDPGELLEAVSVDPPEWSFEGVDAARADPSLADVDLILLSGSGSISELGEAQPILVADDGTVVAVRWQRERGTVVWLADALPLLNRSLAEGDSAGLAMALTGGRDVVFDEFRHGFGGDSLWQSLPDRWQTALTLLVVAALATMIAYGRRLGPPEEIERGLQPDRAQYVESVAAILARTGRLHEAAHPVRDRGQRLLAARGGLPALPSDEQWRRAGEEAGLTTTEVEALIDPTGDLVEAGRALSKLDK